MKVTTAGFPAPPTGLHQQQPDQLTQHGMACLAWNPVDNNSVDHYDIWKCTVNDFAQAVHAVGTSHCWHNALVPIGVVHYFWVTVTDQYGVRSAPSKPVSVARPNPVTPQYSGLNDVAFWCDQCNKAVPSFTWYGGRNYMVRCHNVKEDVYAQPAIGASAQNPTVVHVFQKKAVVSDGRPNVRFHCQPCDTITAEFDWQRDPDRNEHVFIVHCHGGKCEGKRHVVKYADKVMHEHRAFSTPTPVVLPIEARLLGAVARPAAPPQPVTHVVKKVVRKLRLN